MCNEEGGIVLLREGKLSAGVVWGRGKGGNRTLISLETWGRKQGRKGVDASSKRGGGILQRAEGQRSH